MPRIPSLLGMKYSAAFFFHLAGGQIIGHNAAAFLASTFISFSCSSMDGAERMVVGARWKISDIFGMDGSLSPQV